MATDARWLTLVLLLAGCGRSGVGAGTAPGGYVCGPGTHAAGDVCVADGDPSGPALDMSRPVALDMSRPVALDMSRPVPDLAVRDANMGDAPADLATAPLPPSGNAVTYQIDPAHSGGQPDSALHPPLSRRWSVTLDSRYLSYPLIVGDRVFVTGSGGSAARLYALSASDGSALWGPVTLAPGMYRTAYAAWDDGRLFVIDENGTLRSFDAATGAPGWTRPGFSQQVGPPVAVDGSVYLELDDALLAIDERDGSLRWSGGDGESPTSPAWTPQAVILEYVSGELYAKRLSDGNTEWMHPCYCSGGGGGDFPVVYDGRVYASDTTGREQAAYRLSDGAPLGAYTASAPPAFENGLGFFRVYSTVEARDDAGRVRWSFGGDGALDSTPIAAGGFVYVGSSNGRLYAVDEVSGHPVWSDALPAAIAPSDYNDGADHITGLAASSDLLVVPAGSTLTAYGN